MVAPKKHSSRPPIATVQSEKKKHFASKLKPAVWVGILLLLPLVVLIFYTFFNSSSQNRKPSDNEIRLEVPRQTPQELVEKASLALAQGDTNTFLEIAETKIKDPNAVNSQGDSLLITAATYGNMQAAQWLLAAGADVNKQSYNSRDTAILRSVSNDHDDITNLLVYAKANLNLRNNYQQSPLGIAVEKQKDELVDLFLQNGVKAGLDGETLLRSSARQNHTGVLGMLKGGVNPNVKNQKGNTPLIISASLGDNESVQNLLSYQADVNQANDEGNTPLIYAARYNHPETVLLLFASHPMQQEEVEVNLQNNQGETALYWAALKGYAPVVKILLALDANKNLKTKEGLSAVDIAKKYKRKEVLQLMNMNLNKLKESFNQDQQARAAAAAEAKETAAAQEQ